MTKTKRNKDKLGWRYCLTMMLMCFLTGVLAHSIWVQYMDWRYTRKWESDKIKTLDRCERMVKLAIGVTLTEKPGPPELQAWVAGRLSREHVPEGLLEDYDNWQVLKATHAVLAQMEHFELRDRMPEGDRFQEDFKQLGVLIDELYADTGRPVGAK